MSLEEIKDMITLLSQSIDERTSQMGTIIAKLQEKFRATINQMIMVRDKLEGEMNMTVLNIEKVLAIVETLNQNEKILSNFGSKKFY